MDIKNIKVTATYEENDALKKLDALMEQYNMAKRVAETQKEELAPLILAMGDKKFELIKEQIQVIKKYAEQIVKITKHDFTLRAEGKTYNYNTANLYCYFNGGMDSIFDFTLNGYTYTADMKPDNWYSEKGIITCWNEEKIYEQLINSCEKILENEIRRVTLKTNGLRKNYENMKND